MNIGDICSRAVVSIGVNDPVRQAAEMMRNYHVGSLVVTESSDGGLTPVGMLTDRDIVVGIVAKDVDPLTVTVGDIMSPDPLIAAEDDDVAEILEDMRKQGVRRIPVVDEADKLIGIFALDDLLQLLAVQMDLVAGIVGSQRLEETRLRA
ncbi:MAG: CBS domain-containing protein [Gammaproteobacteria bacterium]|nr:CBS domain-containing protein [Gammaproteobacteria bacterium]MBU6508734.1 CBS domain-containing protein [Gammaproteobacteria bacterium]MDE1983040.1 CBS domain-containing protein [Gammaproteobacteria bacterium]MDE2107625.1 CBS domain-containing protein [Gammaproteobacteria bacterium]MDE2460934.1 CBS domain-containing protein [Gammaproteobacteria bacterium]